MAVPGPKDIRVRVPFAPDFILRRALYDFFKASKQEVDERLEALIADGEILDSVTSGQEILSLPLGVKRRGVRISNIRSFPRLDSPQLCLPFKDLIKLR